MPPGVSAVDGCGGGGGEVGGGEVGSGEVGSGPRSGSCSCSCS